ncbi:MAG: Gfo/Idh/MocA family oxidoreductase [Candidatus Omnitrophota bacterium]
MNVGIVGIGKLGSIHLRIYKEHSQIRNISLADCDESKLLQNKNLPGFLDYHKLIGRIDLVSIATPTSTHYEIARFFIKNKIPVLVEKPLASNYQEARKIVDFADKNKTLLVVGHVERHNNAYLAVKKILKTPLFIECHRLSCYPYRSLDVSVVLDLMIHDLDIILDLVKDTPKKVEAKGVKVLSKSVDIANVRITFSKGCVANITASRISAKKERKIRIFMPRCYVSLDYAEQEVEIYEKTKNGINKKALHIQKEEPLKKEISEFINLVRSKKFTLEYAKSAKNALGLALKIQNIIAKP